MFKGRKKVKKEKEKAVQQSIYILNREVTDAFLLLKAFTYIIWFNGITIDENTYNGLPEDCKRVFMKLPTKTEEE